MTATLRLATRAFAPFESALRKQFQDFAARERVDARLEVVPLELNPLHETLVARRELATSRWDLALVSTDWIVEAQRLGLVEDLAPLQARGPIPDFPAAWSESLLRLQRFAGGLWGLPYHDGPQCLIYRTDLLAEAGLAVPTTWSAFLAAARRLHAPEQGRSGTVLALFPDGHNTLYDLCIQIWTRGGEPFGPDGRPQLATPEACQALDFLRGLARDAGAVVPGARELDSVRSGLLFSQGKVALMTHWFGFAALGDSWAESRVKGKVGVAPVPAGSGPAGRSVSLNSYWLLCVGAGSRNKEVGWRFLRHCATPSMDRLTTMEGAIGVRRSTWTDPEINRVMPYYRSLEALHERAREMPSHPRLAALSHVIDDLMGQAVVAEDPPSAVLLGEAQARCDALLAEG